MALCPGSPHCIIAPRPLRSSSGNHDAPVASFRMDSKCSMSVTFATSEVALMRPSVLTSIGGQKAWAASTALIRNYGNQPSSLLEDHPALAVAAVGVHQAAFDQSPRQLPAGQVHMMLALSLMRPRLLRQPALRQPPPPHLPRRRPPPPRYTPTAPQTSSTLAVTTSTPTTTRSTADGVRVLQCGRARDSQHN